MKKALVALFAGLFLLSGCSTAADVASQNISVEADSFRVDRRIVAINLITGDYLFEATGKCSINADTADSQLELTCKIGPEAYQKHYIGIPVGANVTYVVEQLQTVNVDEYHYTLVFKPEVIVPTIIR